jgi:hypothetical protein
LEQFYEKVIKLIFPAYEKIKMLLDIRIDLKRAAQELNSVYQPSMPAESYRVPRMSDTLVFTKTAKKNYCRQIM